MVGLPRLGKSTRAKAFVEALPAAIVNPDAIRLAIHGQRFIAQAEPYVWLTARTMVESLFLAGHKTVILDATNTTHKRRNEWRNKNWEREYIYVDTPKNICIERAKASNQEDLIMVIERMDKQFEPLSPEDYD